MADTQKDQLSKLGDQHATGEPAGATIQGDQHATGEPTGATIQGDQHATSEPLKPKK
ncbi:MULTISPECIES: hypothetical protein [unclassified Streptomyces]|uniref:hypothetical protein n=1 Tax=unclassified Streptomyces TaxID=2593676 RepID=UPI0033AC187B